MQTSCDDAGGLDVIINELRLLGSKLDENMWMAHGRYGQLRPEINGLCAQIDILHYKMNELQGRKPTTTTRTKRSLSSNTCASSKLARLRLPQLSGDIVVRILSFSKTPVIQEARLVCRLWNHVVEEQGVWEMRCQRLELLPVDAKNTVLGRCATRTQKRARKVRVQLELADLNEKKGLALKLGVIYREHYSTWIHQICKKCEPEDLSTLRKCCKRPSDFRWVDEDSLCTYIYACFGYTVSRKSRRDGKEYFPRIDDRIPGTRKRGAYRVEYIDPGMKKVRKEHAPTRCVYPSSASPLRPCGWWEEDEYDLYR